MLKRSILCAIGGGALVLGLTADPAAAAPGPSKGRCVSELSGAGVVGRDLNPGKANFILGTEGDDVFTSAMLTDGVDVICGFGGNDSAEQLGEVPAVPGTFPGSGDVFLGGEGNDSIGDADTFGAMYGGTFYGGAGDDSLGALAQGTFYGEAGNDSVLFADRGLFVGGDGDDSVEFSGAFGGTFEGGAGSDSVRFLQAFTGTALFNGGEGDDSVVFLATGGVFNGGPGNDTFLIDFGGTFNQ